MRSQCQGIKGEIEESERGGGVDEGSKPNNMSINADQFPIRAEFEFKERAQR